MRIDKTYSELWDLVNTHEDATVKETAKMAINALHKLQEEIRQLKAEKQVLSNYKYMYEQSKY